LIRYPSFVSASLSRLQLVSKPQRESAARYLALLAHLIAFFKLPKFDKSVGIQYDRSGIPDSIAYHLLVKFAEEQAPSQAGKSPRYPQQGNLETKLACHIMIVALAARQFALDHTAMLQLAADLAIPSTQ